MTELGPGFRCIAPTWPLGAHSTPTDGADLGAEATARRINEAGGRAFAYQADVSAEHDVKAYTVRYLDEPRARPECNCRRHEHDRRHDEGGQGGARHERQGRAPARGGRLAHSEQVLN